MCDVENILVYIIPMDKFKMNVPVFVTLCMAVQTTREVQPEMSTHPVK